MTTETIQELHRCMSKEHAQMVSTTDGSEEAYDHTQITLLACIDIINDIQRMVQGWDIDSLSDYMNRCKQGLQKQLDK